MKTYYAKALVWKEEEGKKRTREMGISANANTKVSAHRSMMEQFWKWGYLLRRFIVLDTVPLPHNHGEQK